MILLIGATGFLGPPVLKELLKRGFEVNCLIRTSGNISKLEETAGKAGKKITFSAGTLQSPDSIIYALKKAKSAVYMVDLEYTDLLGNFLYAANRTGLKRAVFISSTTVLTPLESEVKNKKIASEELIKKSGLDYTILRPTMIYGSEDDNNFSRMLKFIKKRGFFVIFGKGDNLIQPVYISDVAGAVAAVTDNNKTFKKVYNIAGKKPLTYNRMLEIVRCRLKKRFAAIKIPVSAGKFLISAYSVFSKNPPLSPDQIDRTGIDKAYSYQQAASDFNYSPLSFEEGIRNLIKELDNR